MWRLSTHTWALSTRRWALSTRKWRKTSTLHYPPPLAQPSIHAPSRIRVEDFRFFFKILARVRVRVSKKTKTGITLSSVYSYVVTFCANRYDLVFESKLSRPGHITYHITIVIKRPRKQKPQKQIF